MDIKISNLEKRFQKFVELVDKRLEQEREDHNEKKNKNFVQMYPKGFDRAIEIIEEYPLAGRLYMFLAKHVEPGTGAIVASQKLLADELNISVRSV